MCRNTCNYFVLGWWCRQADNGDELEQLRIQFDNSEAARRDLEKRVKEAGSMQQRLLMACTVGYNIALPRRSLCILAAINEALMAARKQLEFPSIALPACIVLQCTRSVRMLGSIVLLFNCTGSAHGKVSRVVQ